jgi:hypothetical protein
VLVQIDQSADQSLTLLKSLGSAFAGSREPIDCTSVAPQAPSAGAVIVMAMAGQVTQTLDRLLVSDDLTGTGRHDAQGAAKEEALLERGRSLGADGHARLPFASKAQPIPAVTTMRPWRSNSQRYR